MLSLTLKEACLAQLVVRNIEDRVKAGLQRRARRHGRSMEQEVREILRDAAHDEEPARGLGTAISSLFAKGGLASDIPELRGQSIQGATFDV
jgi:plasmid stability protein